LERKKIEDDLRSKSPLIKLLYVTPEMIVTKGFIKILGGLRERKLLSLFAIDEAHCISKWGKGFRPKYRNLLVLRKVYPSVPIVVLTATVTKAIQNDIIDLLNIKPKIFQASFNRENIHYNIKYTEETKEKMTEILNFIIEHVNDSGIIYCHKREDCDVVSEYLKSSGISASSYHAGMNNEQRKNALDGWISGIYSTIVATIAFGMGVDKQDVRYVIHYTIPKTLEDFYQETGRAGRDGKLSESIVYYSASDFGLFKFLLSKQDTNKKKRRRRYIS